MTFNDGMSYIWQATVNPCRKNSRQGLEKEKARL